MRLPKLNNPNKLVFIDPKKYPCSWTKAPSKGQQKLQDFLFPYLKGGIVCQEVRIPGSLMKIDLLCWGKKLIIEYSPSSHHGTFNKFFHKGSRSNYLASIKRDLAKEEYAKMAGFKFIEITEQDLPNLSYNWFVEKFGVYL